MGNRSLPARGFEGVSRHENAYDASQELFAERSPLPTAIAALNLSLAKLDHTRYGGHSVQRGRLRELEREGGRDSFEDGLPLAFRKRHILREERAKILDFGHHCFETL